MSLWLDDSDHLCVVRGAETSLFGDVEVDQVMNGRHYRRLVFCDRCDGQATVHWLVDAQGGEQWVECERCGRTEWGAF